MDNIEKIIGKKVRDARLKLGLSQSALAKSAKTSLTTINRLEKGHQFPHSSTLTEITKALGISISDIYMQETKANDSNDRATRILKVQERLNRLSDKQLEDLEDSLDQIELNTSAIIVSKIR